MGKKKKTGFDGPISEISAPILSAPRNVLGDPELESGLREAIDDTLTIGYIVATKGNYAPQSHGWMERKVRSALFTGTDKSTILIGLGVSGGVAIAGLATGGIAWGALAAIAAGTWAIKKIARFIGDQNRWNRDWIKNCSKAYNNDTSSYAHALGTAAKDAIRRAVDHFRKAHKLAQECAKLAETQYQWATCVDAINYAKAVVRFLHESHKARNYILAVLDFCLFVLMQYRAFSVQWNSSYDLIVNELIKWAATHDHAKKCKKRCVIGYMNYLQTRSNPIRPKHKSGGMNRHLVDESSGKELDITELIDDMEKIAIAIEKALKAKHIRTTTTIVTKESRYADMRFEKLIDTLIQKIDHPGFFTRVGHKFKNWQSRKTKAEKVSAVLCDIFDMGGGFVPALSEANISGALKTILKKTIPVANFLGQKGITFGGFTVGTKDCAGSYKIDPTPSVDELRGRGYKVEDLIKEVCVYFKWGGQHLEKMEKRGQNLRHCDDLWELAVEMGKARNNFAMMEQCLGHCVTLAASMAVQCKQWTEQEAMLWHDMNDLVKEWIRESDHMECMRHSTYCYGRLVKYGYPIELLGPIPHKPLK